ncbi:hypothetical protein [Pandoraea bronchicola]|uniref:Uncharacterized protein n=1 Tax=Pandoraea bronchicola TaxID=2508287 RepID=A0A5E5BYL6_9BURK|nr:hypothetical protein [Pandoraea bronchicola]VVE90426.1 hypothetical protein PBR20603_04410 [Pandoraea bronchicola]
MKEPIDMRGTQQEAFRTVTREFDRVWAALEEFRASITRIDGVSPIRASMLARALAITFSETMFEDSKEWTLISELEKSKDEFWRMVGAALKDEFRQSLVRTK